MRHTHIGSASWSIQHILWFISSFERRDVGEIFVGFEGRWTSIAKYLLLFWFTDFWRSSRYFSSIVRSMNFYYLNVGMSDNLDFWKTIFWILRSKARVPLPSFTQTWQSRVTTFFVRINTCTSLCLFTFHGKLISLMDIHVQHLVSPHFAAFAGIKLKVISAR